MDKIRADYHQDFYGWLLYNSQLLRQGKLSEIDVENIAEELEGMSRSEKRELMSRLSVLLAHLLKWAYEPQRRSKSWEYTIKEQRIKVRELMEESPSLKNELLNKFHHAYDRAILKAAKETKMDERCFPSACPFSLEQALDETFYPQEIKMPA